GLMAGGVELERRAEVTKRLLVLVRGGLEHVAQEQVRIRQRLAMTLLDRLAQDLLCLALLLGVEQEQRVAVEGHIQAILRLRLIGLAKRLNGAVIAAKLELLKPLIEQ